METAEKLAEVFLSSATIAGTKQDAYFESDGKRILLHLLFAASVGHRPIADTFPWTQLPTDETPRDLPFQDGYERLATALQQIQNLNSRKTIIWYREYVKGKHKSRDREDQIPN